jgi:hypothetical protein
MPDLFELAAQARALAADVEVLNETNSELVQTVAENTAAQERQDRRIERAESLITRTWVFVAGLVVLSGIIGVLVFQLAQVTAAEKLAREEGQCVVIAVFLGSYDPNSRLEGEARQRYEDAFAKFRGVYARLDCQQVQPVVPGRGQAATPSTEPSTPPSVPPSTAPTGGG